MSVVDRVDADSTVELLQRAVQTPSITGDDASLAELVLQQLEELDLDRPSSLSSSRGGRRCGACPEARGVA